MFALILEHMEVRNRLLAICMLSASGLCAPAPILTKLAKDGSFNFDKKADLMYFSPQHVGAPNSIHVAVSMGTSFKYSETNPWVGSDMFGSNKFQYYPGDYDGDGLTDIGYFNPEENSFHVARSTGRSFEYAGRWLECTPFPDGEGAFYVGDYDGDGADDLGYFDPDHGDFSVTLARKGGVGFGKAGSGEWSHSSQKLQRGNFYPGDFNGDKKTDLGYFESRDSSFHVAFSTGASFGEPRLMIESNGFGDIRGTHYVGDFNGDMRDDLGYFNPFNHTFHVSVSTGTRFVHTFHGTVSTGTTFVYKGMWVSPGTFGSKNDRHFVGDFDGDGVDDLGYFEDSDNTFHVNISTRTGFFGPGTGRWLASNTFGNREGAYYVSRPGRRTLGNTIAIAANSAWDSGAIPPDVVPAILVTLDDRSATADSIGDVWVKGNIKVIEQHAEAANIDVLEASDAALSSRMSIKVRGASSRSFPKKSFGIEFQKLDGSNNNVPLLGMPSDEDWVLHSCYADKTCLRNVLSYSIASELMGYAPRTRFVELWVNREYHGLYVAIEKIKSHPSRVNVPEPASGQDGVTGGYIVKSDGEEESHWKSMLPNLSVPFLAEATLFWTAHDPDWSDLRPEQKSFIKSHFDNFEGVMNGAGWADQNTGYKVWIDIRSWVDYSLMQELSNNSNGYTRSMYLVKKPTSQGGLLHMGPIWDFDVAYGNHQDDLHAPKACGVEGWRYKEGPGFAVYSKLWTDGVFRREAGFLWGHARHSSLSDARINEKIDAWVHFIGVARARDNTRWQTLGKKVFVECTNSPSYSVEVLTLRNWIESRLTWMDKEIPEAKAPIVFPVQGCPLR